MTHGFTMDDARRIATDYGLEGPTLRGYLEIADLLRPVGPYGVVEIATTIAARARRGSYQKSQHLLALGAAFLRADILEAELLDYLRAPDMTVGEFLELVESDRA